MPLTICVALLQRRLPGNVTGQVCFCRCRDHDAFVPLHQFFEGPLRAGEQFAVVVALAKKLRADRHAGRPLEHRQR